MVNNWTLQDAKNRLSELIKKAQKSPQYISARDDHIVVVISQKDYESLTAPTNSLVEFFRKSPLVGLNLDLSRDKN